MAAVFDKYTEVNNAANTKLDNIRPEILKKRFLELYENVGSISKTCDMLGMVRRTLYHWKQQDPEFLKLFEEADVRALGLLEDEAIRRAMFGIDKPVYQGGKLAGFTKEYSDTLLIVLLKARAPHKYKERFAGELTGADGRPLVGDFKITHIHSATPLANDESQVRIEDIDHELIPISNDKNQGAERQTET